MADIPDIEIASHLRREIPADAVLGLYRSASWWPERTAEQVRAVLRASPATGAWHGQELIGFARAVTDHVLLVRYYEASSFKRTGQVVMHRNG